MLRVGWKNLFIKMYRELKEKNIKLDNIYAKSKLGATRIEWKCSKCTDKEKEEIENIFSEYEKLSNKTCELCGKKGILRQTSPMFTTLCDECFEYMKNDKLKKYLLFYRNLTEFDYISICQKFGILKEKEKITYFGLKVYKINGSEYVREDDIKKLPFYDFWQESAESSTMIIDEDLGNLVFLYDWKAFCHIFIKTGKDQFIQ